MSNIFSRHRSRVRATRHDHKTSFQRAGRTAGARRRGNMDFGPARVGVCGAACENVSRSSVRAVSRIEASKTETDTLSRGESYCRSQRIQSEATAEKTGDKIRFETAKESQRAGSASKRARRHEFVNCASNYHGARKCGFGAQLGPKRTSCSGCAQQRIFARRDYWHAIRPSSCTT